MGNHLSAFLCLSIKQKKNSALHNLLGYWKVQVASSDTCDITFKAI